MPRDVVAPLVCPSLESLLATPEPLTRWLRGKRPDEVVGECREPMQCVIANFLTARGVADARVGSAISGRYLGEERVLWHQDWTVKLVFAFDRLGPDGTPITASVALRLLDPGQQS